MKKILPCILLLFVTVGFAQNTTIKKPDYDLIKKKIVQKASNLYYPKLVEKFNNADTTMTLDEKRHLYYGFIHQESYSPYTRSDYTDSLRITLKKKNYGANDLKKIVQYSDSLLKYNPFSLKAINYKLYAEKQMKDSISLLKDYTKMRIITDAMLSSGDGLSKETAFFVISPTHEYSLLSLLGYEFGGKQSLIDHYDYLTLAENEDGIEGLYFDVSASLNHMNNLFQKKE
ncbi:DUF4919 domain-containing protein [Aureibaculum sp. 2210JD6-5]|uniref:DUF4919 domain-containing protein n=1 Tax=Aureibaculum sp. 2210JD6-5 TaxID=3103957 RepID=UPI002AAC9C41|nr:DUF4919 domain-containing protein [Aureibaculum sp. 2210JD6-5]MDY7396572.1 DUF4919 domain-containing protein [Aureibaculum sp. 2210JD6-5]